MSESANRLFALKATSEELLLEAKTLLTKAGQKCGDTNRELTRIDIPFDLGTTVQTAYSLLGVLATVGGAVAFIEWMLEKAKKLKDSKSKEVLVLTYDTHVIIVCSSTDIGKLQEELNSVLAEGGND